MTARYANTTVDTDATCTVLSSDGARISYLSTGSGPAVIVVPGALSIAEDYTAFARALGRNYAVHVVQRRGRGLSSPQGEDYSMDKECEDVRALQEATGASFLVGHSFGGLVALEAAQRNQAFTKVAIYEPGVSIDGSISMDWMPGYEKKLKEARHFDAFVEFVRGTGPDRARKTPHWMMRLILPIFISSHERQQLLGLLAENLREHREVARLDSSYEKYRDVTADVLLMYGGKSQIKWVDLATERLTVVLPQSETKAFPTLDHFGIDKKGSKEVAGAVSDFFLN